jgi:hypothetical protein
VSPGNERSPLRKGSAHEKTAAGSFISSRLTGCPCGCESIPGVYLDPDCVTARPVREFADCHGAEFGTHDLRWHSCCRRSA